MTYPNDTNKNDGGMASGTPSGGGRPNDRGEIYTAPEAAKVLGITPRRVRALAQEGKIEGERTAGGWMLFRRSVHSFRDSRRSSETPIRPSDAREWIERTQDLERQLGRLEGRLEIEAVARSTLEESLQRERERADRLEEELRDERSQGFWRRIFGG
jgi:excisionase family DNA binding protein